MTTTIQYPMSVPPAAKLQLSAIAGSMPLEIRVSPNQQLRVLALRVVGASLVLSSTLLWVLPGAVQDPQMTLVKIGVSVFFLLIGILVMTAAEQGEQPDAHFDPIRRELRVLKRDAKGRPRTVLRRSYDSIGCVRFKERTLELYEQDGSLLIQLPMENRQVRQRLVQQLSGAVSISS